MLNPAGTRPNRIFITVWIEQCSFHYISGLVLMILCHCEGKGWKRLCFMGITRLHFNMSAVQSNICDSFQSWVGFLQRTFTRVQGAKLTCDVFFRNLIFLFSDHEKEGAPVSLVAVVLWEAPVRGQGGLCRWGNSGHGRERRLRPLGVGASRAQPIKGGASQAPPITGGASQTGKVLEGSMRASLRPGGMATCG